MSDAADTYFESFQSMMGSHTTILTCFKYGMAA